MMRGWIEFTEHRKGGTRKRSCFVGAVVEIGEDGALNSTFGFIRLTEDSERILVEESYDDLRKLIAAAMGEVNIRTRDWSATSIGGMGDGKDGSGS